MSALLWFLTNKQGRYLLGAALVVIGMAAIYFNLKHSIRVEAQKDIVIESQTQEIQHMHGTADKLNKVINAKSNFRRTVRTQPDSLHEDDGYRRD